MTEPPEQVVSSLVTEEPLPRLEHLTLSSKRGPLAGRPLLRTWLAAFAVLFVATAAWSFASPLGSSPDEPAQLIRAASLVRGQVVGTPLPHATKAQGSTVVVEVPEVFASLANDVGCFKAHPTVPAGCQAPLVASPRDQPVETYVGRYPPLYYLLVGLPTLAFVSVKGIYGARLVSGALSAAMLALAVVSARRCRGAALMGAGVCLAVTPMALYLAGVINPSGLEISSAISAWAGAMALASQGAEQVDGRSVAALGLPIIVLVLVRALSPLWALAAVAGLLLVGPAVPVRVLLKKRCVQVWLAVTMVAVVLSGLWDALAGPFRSEPGTALPPHANDGQIVQLALDRLHLLVLSTIGQFGWLDTPSPFTVIVLWLGALGAVVLVSVCVARPREVIAVVGTLGAWALLSFAFIVAMAREHGIVGQGRDFMGLLVGVPILAGAVAKDHFAGSRLMLRLSGLVIAILALCQIVDFYGTLRRYTVGLSGPDNAFSSVPGGWHPPVPGAVLLVGFALAMAGFVAILRKGAIGQGVTDEAVF